MTLLRRLWEGWKRIAHRIARFNSIVICTVLYFLLIPFVAVPFRLTRDPLRLRGGASFLRRNRIGTTFEEATKQG